MIHDTHACSCSIGKLLSLIINNAFLTTITLLINGLDARNRIVGMPLA